jgi:hypothetical protein
LGFRSIGFGFLRARGAKVAIFTQYLAAQVRMCRVWGSGLFGV